MSSGDSEAPPTYYFSGMTFNPDFYTSTSSTYITKITGKKYFLAYPTAQGDETVSRVYTQNISSITPTEAFNFLDSQTGNIYIGENTTGTSGQIIKIGASALTTVKVGAISIKDQTIDTLSTTSTFSIAGTNRTGELRINCGIASTNSIFLGAIGTTTLIEGNTLTLGSAPYVIRVGAGQVSGTIEIATSATRTGALYINSTTGATNSIYLGASGTTTIIDGNTLTLGSALTTTTNANTFTSTGLITANGGVTIPTGKVLTVAGNIGTTLLPLTMNASTSILYTSSTISCRSGGMATFTSWNSADVNIGTESFSDLYLGYYGTTTNAKTTRIRTENVIIGGGSTGTTTINNTLSTGVGTLSGATAYESTSATTYTIPNAINRDYYLLVLLASGTSVITMPTLKVNQIVHIRVYNTAGTAITVKVPTSTTGSFYPNGSNASFATQWTAFPAGTTQNFYCTGSDWVGF